MRPGIFQHGRIRLLRQPVDPGQGLAFALVGRVLEVDHDTLTAGVQAQTGVVYRNVPVDLPPITSRGRARGRVSIPRKDDLVWLEFRGGAASAPRIRGPIAERDGRRLEKFLKNYEDHFAPAQDFADFHDSGHGMIFGEKRVAFVDSDGTEVLRIDFEKKEIVLQEGFRLRVAGESGTEADSAILTAQYLTTQGYVNAAGGVGVIPGVVAPGQLLAKNILAEDAIVGKTIAAQSVTAGDVTASGDVRAGSVGLRSHGHLPAAPPGSAAG